MKFNITITQFSPEVIESEYAITVPSSVLAASVGLTAAAFVVAVAVIAIAVVPVNLIQQSLREKGDSTNERSRSGKPVRKPFVGVCTSAVLDNVKGFVEELRAQCANVVKGVEFIQLPYSRLDDFELEKEIGELGIDVLILCHSIDNRRLSLTDVTDALYDKFIPRASRKFGKDRFLVIAHDFKWNITDDIARQGQEHALRLNQPTVYKHAKVMLAGSLKDVNVGLTQDDWQELSAFLQHKGQTSTSPKNQP